MPVREARRRTSPPKPRLADFPQHARRIALTVSCRDLDDIPKVSNAGALTTISGQPVQVMHNGVVVERDGYFGGWMTEIIRCLRGHHEPQEERVFAAIIDRLVQTEDRPSMIELGSYWAYYSLWFRRAMPASRIVLLEPDPAYLGVGRRNFDLNAQEHATFVHGVVAAGNQETVPFVAESDGQRYELPRHDLESLLAIGNLERVSLVLADIQGAETILVESARPLLAAGRVRCLMLSTHHHSISGCATTHQDLLALLADLGAHIIAEHSVGESFSGDGLIAASFDPRDRDLMVGVSLARQRDSLFGELEHDLEGALARASRAEAERDRCREDADAMRSETVRAREALAAVEGGRLWRWTALPRHFYARFKSTRRRAH